MNETQTSLRKRINIMLPQDTLRLMRHATRKGNRSRFIDEAVRYYIQEKSYAYLKKKLKEGAKARAKRDIFLAKEWFALENAAWGENKKS